MKAVFTFSMWLRSPFFWYLFYCGTGKVFIAEIFSLIHFTVYFIFCCIGKVMSNVITNTSKTPRLNPDLRVSFVAELPRLSEGGQCSKVERLMLADQLTLHLPRRTDGVGLPLESGRTTRRLWEQLWGAVACRLVAGEEYGGLTFTRGWRTERKNKARETEIIRIK